MTAHQSRIRRKNRGGKGLIPPNPRQWDAEHNALDLREEMGLDLDQRFLVQSAFRCLENIRVIPHGQIPAANCFIELLRGDGSAEWSGAAIPLPGGKTLVIYNDSHPRTRARATLMEEFFHLRLGHRPSTIRVHTDGLPRRSYDSGIEFEAYASGAAALVPYKILREALSDGKGAVEIGRQLDVSPQLIEYRMKVTKLWTRRAKIRRRAS